MYVECGTTFFQDGEWKRCVLANRHDGKHQDRLDSVEEVLQRGKYRGP